MDPLDDKTTDLEQTPASVPEPTPAEAPLTRAELEAWQKQVLAEAEERGRRSAQSWIDRERNREKAVRQHAAAVVDDPDVQALIAEEDRPLVREKLAQKAMQYMASEPEPAPETHTYPPYMLALVREAGLTMDDPEIGATALQAGRFQTEDAWIAAVVKRSEAVRHNPRRNEPPEKKPLMVDMGSGAPTATPRQLLDQYKAARDRGDMETVRRLGAKLDQLTGA
jgi:hypothetical protein